MSVSFTFGGIKRDLRIELRAAPKLEAATGLGYIALYEALYTRSATLKQVCEVLRIAFLENGTKFSSDEVLDMVGEDGIVQAYVASALIICELMKAPEKRGPLVKKQAGKNGRQHISH